MSENEVSKSNGQVSSNNNTRKRSKAPPVFLSNDPALRPSHVDSRHNDTASLTREQCSRVIRSIIHTDHTHPGPGALPPTYGGRSIRPESRTAPLVFSRPGIFVQKFHSLDCREKSGHTEVLSSAPTNSKNALMTVEGNPEVEGDVREITGDSDLEDFVFSREDAILSQEEWWSRFHLLPDLELSALHQSCLKDVVSGSGLCREPALAQTALERMPNKVDQPPSTDHVAKVLVKGVETIIPLHLTAKERQQIRKRNRKQHSDEYRAKVQSGEIKEVQRITKRNIQLLLQQNQNDGRDSLMSGVTDLEQRMRTEEANRRQNHEERNAAAKLTHEERNQKLREKHMRDAEKGLTLSVYRVLLSDSGSGDNNDDMSRRKVWKLTTNAHQLHLTGIMVCFQSLGVILLEAGEKPTRQMEALICRRIPDWGATKLSQSPITTHRFEEFSVRRFDDETTLIQYLNSHRCDAMWYHAKLIQTGPTVSNILGSLP